MLWRERWEAVERIKLQELRAETIEESWRKVNALYALAHTLGLLPQPNSAERMEDYLLWAKLRELHQRRTKTNN